MPSVNLTTYKDLTEHLVDFMGANPGSDASRDARRAAQGGLTCIARSHLWSYYNTRGRIATVAPLGGPTQPLPIMTGSYTAATRLFTLDGAGTFPTWSRFGTLILPAINLVNATTASIAYQIVAQPSSNQVQLSVNDNPGVDLPTGTSFTLYRDTYPLPLDCTAIDRAILIGYATFLEFENPGQWLLRQQIYRGPALPRFYTIRGDADYMGVMSMSFFPPPDNSYEVEFMYNRQPRPLKVESYSAGKVSAVNGSTTLTGVGTNWNPSLHTGTIVRLSVDGVNLPTSWVASNPPALERVVLSVDAPNSITLDNPADATYQSVMHVISDPADIEPLAMKLALLRACEYQLAISRNRRDKAEIEKEWVQELIRAREADSRNFSSQSPRTYRPFPTRLADFPRGPDA